MQFAICNELFENWAFGDVCSTVARLGYQGLEIAPFTLAPLITQVTQEKRRTLKRQAEDAGLKILGLHWLLAKTSGFHLNSREEAVRDTTAEYLADLARCCADLGGNVLVFGSPAARRIPEGASFDDAMGYAADTIRRFVDVLAERDVYLCLEPLAPSETDFLQTAAEADRLRRMVGHPNVLLHLDVKAMSSEALPIPDVIRTNAAVTGHFHANDPNLRGPGMGEVDFVPIFKALRDVQYDRWVSVEVFDFKPDPETIARESIEYMKKTLAQVDAG